VGLGGKRLQIFTNNAWETLSAPPVNDGKWHHFAMISPVGSTVYLDGKQVWAGPRRDDGEPLLGWPLKVGRGSGGVIDELATYQISNLLTGAQVEEHFGFFGLQRTTTTLTGPPSPWDRTTALTFTAAVNATGERVPTGSVRFNDGVTVLATVPLSANRTATLSKRLPVGARDVWAEFLPSNQVSGSMSAHLRDTTDRVATSIVIEQSGTDITLRTIRVRPPTPEFGFPTGFVSVDGTPYPLDATGSVTVTLATGQLAPLAVAYGGDTVFAPSEGSISEFGSVRLIVALPDPLIAGEPAQFTVTADDRTTGTALTNGTIDLLDGATVLATKPVANGQATLTASLAGGDRVLAARFTPTAGSTATASRSVSIPVSASYRTALASVTAPVVSGGSVSFTLELTSPANPAATAAAGLSIPTVADDLGKAYTVTTTATPNRWLVTANPDPGSRTFTGTFPGSPTLLEATWRSGPVVVGTGSIPVSLVLTSANVNVGDQVSGSVEVAQGVGKPFPSGAVKIVVSPLLSVTVLLDATGKAPFAIPNAVEGTFQVRAEYVGDPNYAAAVSSSTELRVTPRAIGLTLEALPPVSGRGVGVVLRATHSQTAGQTSPAGVVTFRSASGTDLGTAAFVNGVAELLLTNFPSGPTEVVARFGGIAGVPLLQSSPVTVQVKRAAAIDANLSAAAVVSTDTVSVAVAVSDPNSNDVPTGSVVASFDGVDLPAIPLVNGDATVSLNTIPPGQYVVSVRYSGDIAFSPVSTVAGQLVVASPIAPVADAGEPAKGIVNTSVKLNASRSVPAGGIASYRWDFGDGTAANGAQVNHLYANVGTFTATLTVTSKDGRTATSTTKVEVLAAPAAGKGARVSVVSGGTGLNGASVFLVDETGSQIEVTTDGNGLAVLPRVPSDGTYKVYAWADGYLPEASSLTIRDGDGAVTINLPPGSIGAVDVDSRQLTRDEIVAAGIDPTDSANQIVTQFIVTLVFGDGPPLTVTTFTNSFGSPVGSFSTPISSLPGYVVVPTGYVLELTPGFGVGVCGCYAAVRFWWSW
jgi:PKD domain/Bacterial Ig-like domain (group 3)/Carboxypeptidase regulatory-like domain